MKNDGKTWLQSHLMHVWSGYEECMGVFLPYSVLIPSVSPAVLPQRRSLQSVWHFLSFRNRPFVPEWVVAKPLLEKFSSYC